MADRFCLECACKGEPLDLGKGKVHQDKNWECPLIRGKICDTCCQIELAGGMGAPDTLEGMVQKTGKTTAEIHAICVACEHGGPDLEAPPALIMCRGEDGEMKKSGPEFEAHDQEFRDRWQERLQQLKHPWAGDKDEPA